MQLERLDLAQAIEQAIEASRPAIDQAGHALVLELPAEPIHVDGDLTRLTQVFSNLLDNAAKYTERGGRIWLTVSRSASDAVVSVFDNGIGIPAHMLAHVFEMFTQVDRTLKRSYSGLGVGLSIVQRLVHMHGGSVRARSLGDGCGSEFNVRIPAVVPVTGAASCVEPEPAGRAQRRILVADDNQDAALTLAMLLSLMGNDTRTAHDGLEALAVAAAFRPEVVFLDIGMPKLDGYEVCRRLRQEPWGKGMVVVALTGRGQEEDKRLAAAAGFDTHRIKPVQPAELEALVGLRTGRSA